MAESNMDISFQEADIENLRASIDDETSAVRQLLKSVYEETSKSPEEDDTILTTICDIGSKLDDAWNNLCNGFDQVSGKLKEIIGKYSTTANNRKDAAGGMKTGL